MPLSFPGRNMMNSSITSKMPRPMKIAVYMISFIRRTTIFVLELMGSPPGDVWYNLFRAGGIYVIFSVCLVFYTHGYKK